MAPCHICSCRRDGVAVRRGRARRTVLRRDSQSRSYKVTLTRPRRTLRRQSQQADRSRTRHSYEVGIGLSHTCRTGATEILAVSADIRAARTIGMTVGGRCAHDLWSHGAPSRPASRAIPSFGAIRTLSLPRAARRALLPPRQASRAGTPAYVAQLSSDQAKPVRVGLVQRREPPRCSFGGVLPTTSPAPLQGPAHTSAPIQPCGSLEVMHPTRRTRVPRLAGSAPDSGRPNRAA